jgi:YesN/AraC family two-component response regulator
LGPYFSEPINDEYWNKITESNHLTYTDVQNLKGFLYGIPFIENNMPLISIVSNLISYINPNATPFSIQYHNFNNQKKESYIYTPKEDFDAYSNAVSKRYMIEQKLLQYICDGNLNDSLLEAKKFIGSPFEPRMKNSLRDQKALLISTNTLFRKAIEPNAIHPVHLHEISSKFANRIESTDSVKELNKIYEKMIREYCFLVMNKSTKQYSPAIRQLLHYIEFNLNLSLNLSDMAEKLHLSVPYISSLFKKEVGMPIHKYINSLRIQAAIKLLNTSFISIQDIAAHVGIDDCNYFTKVFKKEVGLTPSEYRKNLYK